MSFFLDQAACEDAQRREDLARSDAALRDWPQRVATAIASVHLNASNERPALRAFLVRIKCGPTVITEFAAMGTDSLAVAAQYEDLCELSEYIRVVPAARKEEPLPVAVLRNELAQLALRQPVADCDWVTFDNERDAGKGPKLAARGGRMALEAQVQHLRCIGGL